MTVLPLLLAAAALAAPAPKKAGPPAPKKISFQTKDGWTIAALYRAPRKGKPVIVLAHGVASSKLEWDAFAERLRKDGIGTLALDLRGHQDSVKGPKGRTTFKDFDASQEWPKAVEDVEAGARWLEARGIAPERIALGGASIGANLAAAAAADRPKTPFLLLLSPGPDYRGVGFRVRAGLPTLIAASPPDGFSFQLVPRLKGMPGLTVVAAPGGHGVQMLSDDGALSQILAWLKR